MSDSMWPHRWQPTRLPRPWDSPGKNTGVGCHFLLQCMKGKSEREVAQLCLTLRNPMDCSLPGSSVHGIFQARVLEWGARTIDRMTEMKKNTSIGKDVERLALLHINTSSEELFGSACWHWSILQDPEIPLLRLSQQKCSHMYTKRYVHKCS